MKEEEASSHVYEYDVLEATRENINEQLDQRRILGWEVAGEASCRYFKKSYATYIFIPIKRKKK